MKSLFTERLRNYHVGNLALLLGVLIMTGSCAFVKDHTSGGMGSSMSKVRRAERLFKRQEYERAISLCNEAINNGGNENARRQAKFQLARIYFETRQFEKTVSLYDELLYKPSDDVLVTDVTTYIDLLKRTGRVEKARQTSEVYANAYKNNARFTNLQESLVNYYNFYNRDSLRNVKVDSLRLNLPGYQYGLALYKDNIVFLSNDFKKNEAQSFYTNSKLYMISEDGIEPFNNSLKGILQVGPASFYDQGKRVIYTSNRFTDVKNEKNSYINYNNGTQLLAATYQENHDAWSKPVPVKLGKSSDSWSFLHPSVASNGKRLYFASDMPGGQGGTDIYYTDWDKAEKRWKAPVNMGPKVNTNGNELYPFIMGDKLFFSSNGLQGFGGLDIFMIDLKKPEEGPVHLPYPVNTQFDDLNAVLDESKLLLYFTSDRSGVHDNDHIYVLNLKKNPLRQLGLPYPGKPVNDDDKVPYTMMETDGRQQLTLVGDKSYDNLAPVVKAEEKPAVPAVVHTAVPVSTSSREVKDYADNVVDSSPEMIPWQNLAHPAPAVATAARAVTAATAPNEGQHTIDGKPEQLNWQASAVGKTQSASTGKKQTNDSSEIHVSAYTLSADSASRMPVSMWKIPGAVYFDLNSYIPQDKEWRKLDSIFYIWKAQPQRLIIVNGHTDIIGTEKYNLALSKNRAAYIQECLLSRGVEADRIRINYFGSTRPVLVASQYSLDVDREKFILQQGVNRRCEITIQ
ncbi:OmpA family protein [Chitinophaga qingshengii]|uniref:OmpA family protein n=1 Tax=Chitinophaga qingshengii TaxID=1569794 RepID=A0ABR7TL98_9BACT|nr:OmpA family protein [Chitinophaga qingshengii]MBC9930313.1 OmpA family protein [Chitinophaga qingshengii]